MSRVEVLQVLGLTDPSDVVTGGLCSVLTSCDGGDVDG